MVSVPTAPTALDDVASAAGNGEAVEELLDLVADAKRAGVVSADDLDALRERNARRLREAQERLGDKWLLARPRRFKEAA